MTHRTLWLVAALATAAAACITSPLDGSEGEGTIARNGFSPKFSVSGYLLSPDGQVFLDIKNQHTGNWEQIAKTRSSKDVLVDVYKWKISNLQIYAPQYLGDGGSKANVELRARTNSDGTNRELVTFTPEAWECAVRKMNEGDSPAHAGAGCYSGTTTHMSWEYNGVNFDNNSFSCASVRKVFALAEEDGHRLAVRLTPPSWPFEVRQLRYHLVAEDDCRRNLTHKVQAYVGTGDAPPASGSPVRSFTRKLPKGPKAERAELIDLDTPIILEEGEHLFVSIEMQHNSNGKRICVPACSVGGTYVPGRTWWSNAASAPYPWQELGEFGIRVKPRIGASGVPH